LNFFGLQDSAKRDSWALLFAFSAAMLFNAIVISIVAFFVAKFVGIFKPNVSFVAVQWAMIAPLWGYILFACFKRWRDLSAGGHGLAIWMDAEYVSEDATEKSDKQLLNVVEEMAIASTQEAPVVFCMREETAINAFVLGNKSDIALVVTQGAIDKLNREELASVVAHEYGHISNKDLTINMRLLIVLAGLNAIDEAGLGLIMAGSGSGYKRYGSHRHRNSSGYEGAIILIVAGIILRVLGSVMVFTGELIKSAFSRKRELLADAKSVQYTRDSWSLAATLDKINTVADEPALSTPLSGELDHMCFRGPWEHTWFAGWLSSHPPPLDRIDQIEPHYAVKSRQKNRAKDSGKKQQKQKSNRTVVPVDAAGPQSFNSIKDYGEELSIVLSMMVGVSGYKNETASDNYSKILKCYTDTAYPYRLPDEPGIEVKFEKALDTLLQQPATQRQALLDHIAEIMELDGISMPEEKKMLEHITTRLNPPGKAA